MSYPSAGNYWLTTLFALCTLFSMTQCGARGLRTHFVWIWIIIANLLADISAMECAHLRA